MSQSRLVECEGSRPFYGRGGDGWTICSYCWRRVVVNGDGRAPHQRRVPAQATPEAPSQAKARLLEDGDGA